MLDRDMDVKDQIISHVVAKCSKSSLPWTLKQWGRLQDINVDQLVSERGSTKAKLAKKIAEISEEKCLHAEIIGDLELAYILLHSSKKLWQVFKLKGCSETSLCLDPRRLRSKLINAAKRKWRQGGVSGNMKMFSGAVWLRLHFDSSTVLQKQKGKSKVKLFNPNQSVFLVIFHNSPYVIISQSGVKLAGIVREAIKDVVEATSLKNMNLSGHHVMSLADIVHKGNNEFVSSEYRDEESKQNPLRTVRQSEAEDLNMSIDGVIDENKHQKIQAKKSIESKFGSSAPPVLECLEYQFDCASKSVSNMMLKSSVELRGTNVLGGLSQLSALGLMDDPLPAHLTAVMDKAKNSFRMLDKKH